MTFTEIFPFDIGKGQSANTTRWRKMAHLWGSDGVLLNFPPDAPAAVAPHPKAWNLAAELNGTQFILYPGALFIRGYYAELASALPAMTVGANGTVVAQADLVNQVINVVYRDNVVDYGTNPASNYRQDIDTPNTTASIYEVPLWLISSGQLVDLRTFANPVAGLNWWQPLAGPISVATGQFTQQDMLICRVPYLGQAFIQGSLLLTFMDPSSAQSAACSLTYQSQVSGQAYISPAIQPAISGGLPANQPFSIPVSLTASLPITQGRKTVGWKVTAGTGPLIQISQLTVSMTMTQVAPTGP